MKFPWFPFSVHRYFFIIETTENRKNWKLQSPVLPVVSFFFNQLSLIISLIFSHFPVCQSFFVSEKTKMLSESLNWIFASTWEFVYISKKWSEDRWKFDYGRLVLSTLIGPSRVFSLERQSESSTSLPSFISFVLFFFRFLFTLSKHLFSWLPPSFRLSLVIISSFLFFFFLLLLSFVLQGGEDQINRPALIDWLRRKLEQKRIEMKFLTRNRTKLPFPKPWGSNSIVLITALIHPYPLFQLLLFFLLFPLISFQPFSFFSILTELYTIHRQDEPYTFSFLKTIIPKRT